MELNKVQLQTLIRSGDDSIRLRSKPQRMGFFYIVSRGALQTRLVYCGICDKVQCVASRLSSNLFRHSRSKLHTELLKHSQVVGELRKTGTDMKLNEKLLTTTWQQHEIIDKPIRTVDNAKTGFCAGLL